MRYVMPPLWALHAIPFFLLGLILMYLLAFQWQLLPIFGGYSPGAVPGFNSGLFLMFWRMRPSPPSPSSSSPPRLGTGHAGMMVTTMGEDYVTFAEAKGLKASTIFLRYCVRNAILPQTTALALALGQILSGASWSRSSSATPGSEHCCLRPFGRTIIFSFRASCSQSSSLWA